MSIVGQEVKYTDSVDNWDVQTASLFSSFSVQTKTITPRGITFKPDGTVVFVIDTGSVYAYSLSSAWDITTATFSQSSFVTNNLRDLYFRDDGLKLYVIRSQTTNSAIIEYTLTTAWDLSSISDLQIYNVSAQASNPSGLYFKDDGSSFYITNIANTSILEYRLTTPWNISTSSYVKALSVLSQDNTPKAVSFKPDGRTLFLLGSSNSVVYQYSLSSAWDINTATLDKQVSVAAFNAVAEGLAFRPSGTQMYVVSEISAFSNANIYQFNLIFPTVSAQDLGSKYVSKQYVADNYANILPDRIKGGLWTWGNDENGVLVNGGSNTPKYTNVSDDWLSISVSRQIVGVKRNGTLWSWGTNFFGQLGHGDITHRSSPTQVGSLSDWRYVSTGISSTGAIKTNGTLWFWGYNATGTLGIGDRLSRSSPVQVGSRTDWLITSVSDSSFAITTTGALWAWGANDNGQLGLGDTVHRSSPVQIGTLTNWKTLSTDPYFCSVVIKTDGTMWSWGNNVNGSLGLGDIIHRSSPVQIGSSTDWKTVSNALFSLAIKNNGTLWGWGQNSQGQLGLGDTISRSTPVQIGAQTDWKYVHAGSFASCAIKTNGSLWLSGSNGNARMGIPSTLIFAQSTPYYTWRYAFTDFNNGKGFRVGGYF